MRGFAYLTVTVLVVIAIGVGLVGGLVTPTTTYSLDGRTFSVDFGGHLALAPDGTPGCDIRVAGELWDDHLALEVRAISAEQLANPACVEDFGGPTLPPCFRLSKALVAKPRIRLAGDAACYAHFARMNGNVGFIVVAVSTEGLPAAQAVIRSFRFLG